MAKWTPLPSEQLKYHLYQDAFWKARRQRICESCKIEYDVPPNTSCPQCKTKGKRKFHRLLLLSGRRGGKTRAGAIAIAESICTPNTIAWACAPSNPKLHRYVIPAFQQLIPPDWVLDWSSEHGDLRLKNGSLLHFQTLEDPDQGRGQGLDDLWIDEVCELTKKHWEVISPSLTDRRGGAIFTSSPRSYDWVYQEFFRRAEQGTPGYWAARYRTAENPIISREELEEAKSSMSREMFQQEYEADFVVFTGAVYGGLVPPQILRNDDMVKLIIPEWPNVASWRQVYVGIDTGADHPFGATKMVTTEKGLVVIGEYLERDKSFMQHAAALKNLAGSSTAKYAINKNERQPSLELAQHQIYCQKAENDVVAGTERVKSWLQARQMWFVESACPKTIQQMMSYRWAENTARDEQKRKERVFKLDDELPDTIRYSCMIFPVLPTPPPADTEKLRDISALPGEMRATIERMRKLEDRPAPKMDVVGDFYA